MNHFSDGSYTWFGGPRSLSIGFFQILGFIRKSRVNTLQGDVVVSIFDTLQKKSTEIIIQSNVTYDDHNIPAIYPINDSEFLVANTLHEETKNVIVTRVQINANQALIVDKRHLHFPSTCTYVYLVKKSECEVYLITRSLEFNLTYVAYNIFTGTSTKPSVMFPWKINKEDKNYSGRDGGRPYLIIRERANGNGAIFILTNDHPRAYRNGVYAGYLIEDIIYDLDHKPVHDLTEGKVWDPFSELTAVWPPGQESIPWVQDIQESLDGKVAIALSYRKYTSEEFQSSDSVKNNFKYKILLFSSGKKETEFEFDAGTSLYTHERDYVGGIVINPLNIHHYVFASNYYKSINDLQGSWQLWEVRLDLDPTQIRLLDTSNSIRPMFSSLSTRINPKIICNSHSLVYLKGKYKSYLDTETRIQQKIYIKDKNCTNIDGIHHDLPFEFDTLDFPESDLNLLKSCMRDSSNYFEFGGGASTLLALELGIPNITTVDSDKTLISLIYERYKRNRQYRNIRLNLVHVPFKQIGPWGYEVDPLAFHATVSNDYVSKFTRDIGADLVLIDGRYRVKSALRVVSETSNPLVLLWDDYLNRPTYKRVERWLKPTLSGTRMAHFEITEKLIIPEEYKADSDPL